MTYIFGIHLKMIGLILETSKEKKETLVLKVTKEKKVTKVILVLKEMMD